MPRKRIWFFVVAAALLIWLRPWRRVMPMLRSGASGAGEPQQTPTTPDEVINSWRPANTGAPAAPHPESAFPGATDEPAYAEAASGQISAILDRDAHTLKGAAQEEANVRGSDADQSAEPVAEFGGPAFFAPGEQSAEPDLLDAILAQDDEPDESAVIGALEREETAGAAEDSGQPEQTAGATEDSGQPEDDRAQFQESEAGADEPRQADDLLLIEGIGPRTSTIVTAAGITSFAQLAEADVEQLRQALADAGIKTIDPSTWPEQARLAAEGRWDELKELQARIRYGRIEPQS